MSARCSRSGAPRLALTHPALITNHPSTITHHPSPITHHPSPITHHPSPSHFTLTHTLTHALTHTLALTHTHTLTLTLTSHLSPLTQIPKCAQGADSSIHRTFLLTGMPLGLFFLDFLMFLEPFGLLTVLPFPPWMRQFIPACE